MEKRLTFHDIYDIMAAIFGNSFQIQLFLQTVNFQIQLI